MVVVNGLIWDDWNREHLIKHKITVEEVEEVYHRNLKVYGKGIYYSITAFEEVNL